MGQKSEKYTLIIINIEIWESCYCSITDSHILGFRPLLATSDRQTDRLLNLTPAPTYHDVQSGRIDTPAREKPHTQVFYDNSTPG